MKINIEWTPEEEKQFSEVVGYEMTREELIELAESAVSVKKNKEVLRGFQQEVFNGHDWSTETLSKYLKTDIEDHNLFLGDIPGLEGVAMRFGVWASAFADAVEEVEQVVGAGNMLAVLYNLHARHDGEFLGVPPSGEKVVIPGIEMLRFEDGKIAEHWGIYDFMTTAEEIGADITFTPRKVKTATPLSKKEAAD